MIQYNDNGDKPSRLFSLSVVVQMVRLQFQDLVAGSIPNLFHTCSHWLSVTLSCWKGLFICLDAIVK